MNEKIRSILKKEILRIKPQGKEFQKINELTEKVVCLLEKEIKKRKIKADVFIGGSLAKDTLIKKDDYDIDIFFRFRKQGPFSELLEPLVKKVASSFHAPLQKMHGSRDYFRVKIKHLLFEFIPVLFIRKPKDAANITDLSIFHVSYITKKIRKKISLADDIRLAKQFCFSQGCYGAESYIKGFSGYALELLVSYYGSFLKLVEEIARSKEKIILDPERHYNKKQDILLHMNEAKLQSPIVFVDPVSRERNALAALSKETFAKMQEGCRAFLKRPSSAFFEFKEVQEHQLNQKAKKRHAELLVLEIATDRQEGDIAGTKLLKFSNFLASNAENYFTLLHKEFVYDGKQAGKIYWVIKKKPSLLIKGPPVTAVENLKKFKEKHPRVFIEKNVAYAREKNPYSPRGFLIFFKKKNYQVLKDMGITQLSIP